MGKKIFVSYKYADRLVRQLQGYNPTTVRDYVDILEKKIDRSDHIYKGEDDGEDLSSLADATIGSKLGDKIFDSTVTIVFISKGMKEPYKPENDQWIPWEISYSLKEQSRKNQTSKTNAVLAVVLPDEMSRYDYFMEDVHCLYCGGYRLLKIDFLFRILEENMFNIKHPQCSDCINHKIYKGYPSFIHSVRWDDFIGSMNRYIDIALEIRANIKVYEIRKNV
jgi:hypothetical protein